jgi:decaprenyl-phosphate phosphoribosyltransferase
MLRSEARKSPFAYLLALRPRQWTKNLVVFAAPLFSFQLDLISLLQTLLAFFLFCGISSSFYLLNDVADVESDRRHPTKCKRPIAAGLISIPEALFMAGFLLIGTIIIGWRHSHFLGEVLIAYAILQVFYNLKLKHTVILDVVAIATGFVLRALAGAAATGIEISVWFLLCTAMLALFLGIEKRKAELRVIKLKGGETRKVLYRYSQDLLTRMESNVTTGTLMCYILWSAGPVVQGAKTPWMMLTIPFVVYGIFRYQFLSDPEEISRRANGTDHGGKSERPEEILLTDRPMKLIILGWVFTTLAVLFLHERGILL